MILSLYYLIVVVGPGESLETIRVEAPAGGVQNLVKLSLYYLIVVVGPGERLETIRVEAPAGGVKLLPIILGQLRPERVDRDDKCPAIHTSQC